MMTERDEKNGRTNIMETIDERYACIRCGLSPNRSYPYDLGSCPNYGSSDCPITMGYEEGEECESCRSERWYGELRRILQYQ